jgi:hypothetical protein
MISYGMRTGMFALASGPVACKAETGAVRLSLEFFLLGSLRVIGTLWIRPTAAKAVALLADVLLSYSP